MSSLDVSDFIQPKSDQLNADNLRAGPITVQITGAAVPGGREQPVVLRISGGHMPWKPCKTTMRIMCEAWGTTDASQWVGRWVTLFRDPDVRFGSGTPGGIRISALSHIRKPLALTLAKSKGQLQTHEVKVLTPKDQKTEGAATADLDALLGDNELTRADVDRWRQANGKALLETLTPDEVAVFAGWLAAKTDRLDAIRALIPTTEVP